MAVVLGRAATLHQQQAVLLSGGVVLGRCQVDHADAQVLDVAAEGGRTRGDHLRRQHQEEAVVDDRTVDLADLVGREGHASLSRHRSASDAEDVAEKRQRSPVTTRDR